jgi:hypothetical protein
MEQFCSGITIYVSLWWFVSDTLDDASLVVSDSPAQLMSTVIIVITAIVCWPPKSIILIPYVVIVTGTIATSASASDTIYILKLYPMV